MANFMGPMAPPQAAPNAPPQLDIRTNPSQRAQFKEFMQGMNRPVMPPTTAPIAPMLPAPMPSPMDQIDIFAPAPMADGGVVGGLQDLGQMSGQMVEALNTVVYGGEPGGGFGGGVSSGGGFGGGRLPPPLPGFDMSFFDPERPGYLEQRFERTAPMQTPPSSLPFAQPLSARDAYAQAQADARRQRDDGFMGRVVLPGEMPFDQFAEGYNFRLNNPMQPLQAMQGGLGAAFNDVPVKFEDGGPVGMRRGGVTFKSGESFESGRGIAEQQAERRARNESYFGDIPSYGGSEPPSGGGGDDGDSTSQAVDQAVAAVEQMEAAQQLRDDIIASVTPTDLTFGAPRTDTSGRIIGELTDTDEFFANQNMAADQRLDDAVKSILAVDKTEQFDDLLGDVFVDPLVSSQSPIDDFLARNPQPRETDPINPLGQLMAGDVVYNRGKDSERTVSRFADLENRMGIKDARVNKGQGLSALAEPILSKVASALGGSKATDIFDNVVNQNKQAIIAADTNQIVGYADDGPFGRVYTGRAGYNPFGADGASYTVDPQTGALIVNRQQPNQSDDDERASGQTPATPPPATDPADTTPPPLMITPPTTGFPPSVPDPTDVLVPSTRRDVSVTVPSILPTEGTAPTFLPQSFLDLLASFNRPAPRAMQDGGAVLDKAADDFLEALKVA